MTASTKFDVIIYGASGCMGKSTVQQAVHIFKGLKWAIAGRSEVHYFRYKPKKSFDIFF